MNIPNVSKKKRDITRATEILEILVKSGFGYVATMLEPSDSPAHGHGGKLASRLFSSRSPKPLPVQARELLESLGPTYVKFGQVLSTRPDLVGDDFALELSKLQDSTKPFPYSQAIAILKKELGRKRYAMFSRIERSPEAAASIGQVHRAVLRDGTEVVVKIQRPGIEEQVADDISLMRHFASRLESSFSDVKDYELPMIIDEFERSITKELDYGQEAKNIGVFSEFFAGDEGIRIPRAYPKLSTRHVIVMERMKGTKLLDVVASRSSRFDRKLIAMRGADAFFRQVYSNGFFHADPHPGNILVLKNNVVCFLDFGMVGHITRPMLDSLMSIFICLVNGDPESLVTHVERMGMLRPDTDIQRLRADAQDLMDRYYGLTIGAMDFSAILKDFVAVLRRHRLRVPREYVMVMRAVITLEGSASRLDPDFDIIKVFKPYAKKIAKDRLSPARIAQEAGAYASELAYIAKSLPEDFRKITRLVESGSLKIELEHKNLDVFASRLEMISNRLSVAIILAALLIGSSIAMASAGGSGDNALGLAGFILSAVLGLVLVVSIFRHNRF